VVRYGRSRSLNVIEIGTNEKKTVCDFLSVSVVTRYNDLSVENLRFFVFLATPVSFEALALGVSFESSV